jgi:EAL domain-containing protein (putative c-di-GMP-specific phosphodiesterase class I)
VNLSDVQFKATLDLAGEMERSLTHWRVPHDRMEVEISESVFLEASQIGGTLAKLRRAGLRIALAGFGAGYSSLSHLARYPVNRLKMSQQIVAGLASEPHHAVVLRTALQLGLELGIEVLAEGVETPVQASLVRACGCEQAQGFHFGVPMPLADTSALLRDAANKAAVTQGERSLSAA